MTALTIYDDAEPHTTRDVVREHARIAAILAPLGVQLERWDAGVELSADADDAEILTAYAQDIARLKAAGGYQSCDVIRMTPDHPQREAMRVKFLSEHIHDEDEVRFFVEGSGIFYIRSGGTVNALECTRGDLIVLPVSTRHWFDGGERPSFTAIRLFTTPQGWVARFTGDTIATVIPTYAGAS